MKKALPENAKIARDAKETVQECVSEYFFYSNLDSYHSLHQKHAKNVKMKKEKQLMVKIYCMQSIH